MAKSDADLWNDCQQEIQRRVSASQYTNFFLPITFESFDKKGRTLVLRVPNRAIVEYLEGGFFPLISEVLEAHYGQIRLQYRTPQAATHEKPLVDVSPTEKDNVVTIATNLNAHYTFTTFIEGDSNKLARAVGCAIAEHPRKTTFNPMFVYGPSGCGKTHLINAIGNRTCELYPRKKVLYVPAREFQQQYTDSVRKNEFNDFMRFYQQFDMLIVDDVQEWETSIKTMETFFHVFNYLFQNGRRIILAADRTPAELKNLDDRMLTRFNCGILTELEKPTHQLCKDILTSKIKRDGLAIPPDVVEYIASTANGSVRDLEGVVNALLAHSIFINAEINMALAEKVIGKIHREKPTQWDADQILSCVCQHFGVSHDELLSASRRHDHVRARQVAMYFAYHLAKMNINHIGRMIGNRNHATVAYAIRQIEEEREKSKDFTREMNTIEREIRVLRK